MSVRPPSTVTFRDDRNGTLGFLALSLVISKSSSDLFSGCFNDAGGDADYGALSRRAGDLKHDNNSLLVFPWWM